MGSGQVYGFQDGSADSGVWLRVGSDIYGPDACFSGRLTTDMYTVRPWTTVSHSGPTGSGTAGDPWVDHHGARCRDVGRARHAARVLRQRPGLLPSGVGCGEHVGFIPDREPVPCRGQLLRQRRLRPRLLRPGQRRRGRLYSERAMVHAVRAHVACHRLQGRVVLRHLGGHRLLRRQQTCPVSGSCSPGPGFDNTIDTSADGVDNGFGLQWQRTIGSGASTTVGDWWTFGSIPNIPGQERRLRQRPLPRARRRPLPHRRRRQPARWRCVTRRSQRSMVRLRLPTPGSDSRFR